MFRPTKRGVSTKVLVYVGERADGLGAREIGAPASASRGQLPFTSAQSLSIYNGDSDLCFGEPADADSDRALMAARLPPNAITQAVTILMLTS